jgi:hypothetical protein
MEVVMQELVLNPTQISQWHALVNEAQQNANCKLEEELESYLVFLLIRFTTKPDIADRVLALDYLESLQKHGKNRLTGLKDVGDQCLLYSGLFPQRAKRRRVKISYFVDLGRSAYREISDQTSSNINSLFLELAHSFVLLMDVLQSMRTLGANQSYLEPLQAYDLWQDTGSKQAFKTLIQSGDSLPVNLIDGDKPISH